MELICIEVFGREGDWSDRSEKLLKSIWAGKNSARNNDFLQNRRFQGDLGRVHSDDFVPKWVC